MACYMVVAARGLELTEAIQHYACSKQACMNNVQPWRVKSHCRTTTRTANKHLVGECGGHGVVEQLAQRLLRDQPAHQVPDVHLQS